MNWSLLLQHNRVALFQPVEDLDAAAIRDSSLYRNLSLSILLLRVGYEDGCILVGVVDDRLCGHGENALVFLDEDFGVGGHVGFPLAAWIVDGDTELEGCHIVFFNAPGSDLGDLAVEDPIRKGPDTDARRLAE